MKNWNLLFRRTHLYLGMVLLPWMLLYAISTVVFNHGLAGHGGAPGMQWTIQWEKDYTADLPAADTDQRPFAQRVLSDNQLKGPFGVQRQGQRITIALPSFLHPSRLVYDHGAKKLRAEARQTSTSDLLARLHTRTGYRQDGILHNVWAFAVDAFCIATLVWIATGLYLWWKLSATRSWGFLALGGGIATLAALLATV